jgi:hypothetical protein
MSSTASTPATMAPYASGRRTLNRSTVKTATIMAVLGMMVAFAAAGIYIGLVNTHPAASGSLAEGHYLDSAQIHVLYGVLFVGFVLGGVVLWGFGRLTAPPQTDQPLLEHPHPRPAVGGHPAPKQVIGPLRWALIIMFLLGALVCAVFLVRIGGKPDTPLVGGALLLLGVPLSLLGAVLVFSPPPSRRDQHNPSHRNTGGGFYW